MQSSPKPPSSSHEDDVDEDMQGGNNSSSEDKGYNVMMAKALEESKQQNTYDKVPEQRQSKDLEEHSRAMANAIRQSMQEERIRQALLQNLEVPQPLVVDKTMQ